MHPCLHTLMLPKRNIKALGLKRPMDDNTAFSYGSFTTVFGAAGSTAGTRHRASMQQWPDVGKVDSLSPAELASVVELLEALMAKDEIKRSVGHESRPEEDERVIAVLFKSY